MQTQLISTRQPNLIVYFAGWGTPPSVVKHLVLPEGYDLLICFDYQDLQLDFDFSGYQHIRLVAWSMGVWVAEYALQAVNLPLISATAINGTPYPKHDEWGIPCAVFDGTLAGLSDTNRIKFERRICGDKATLAAYHALEGHRSLPALRAELANLDHAITTFPAATHLPWSKAVIGQKDRIFSAAAQTAYWQGKTALAYQENGEHCLWQCFSAWETLWQ